MYDALETSGGKNETTLILIGTRAPGPVDGWWRYLVDNGDGEETTYRQVHDAPVDDEGQVIEPLKWATVKRAHPLMDWNPYLRPKIESERRKAKRSEEAMIRYVTYRLNRPRQSPQSVLLTVEAWTKVERRPVPEQEGAPIVGIDFGQSRSWSAAVAVWPNGRMEARARLAGIPDIGDREREDSGCGRNLRAADAQRQGSGR